MVVILSTSPFILALHFPEADICGKVYLENFNDGLFEANELVFAAGGAPCFLLLNFPRMYKNTSNMFCRRMLIDLQ
jgi:hypothetical protein